MNPEQNGGGGGNGCAKVLTVLSPAGYGALHPAVIGREDYLGLMGKGGLPGSGVSPPELAAPPDLPAYTKMALGR